MSERVSVSVDRLHRWQMTLARLAGAVSGVSKALAAHGAFGLECLHDAETEADALRKEISDLVWSDALDRAGGEA